MLLTKSQKPLRDARGRYGNSGSRITDVLRTNCKCFCKSVLPYSNFFCMKIHCYLNICSTSVVSWEAIRNTWIKMYFPMYDIFKLMDFPASKIWEWRLERMAFNIPDLTLSDCFTSATLQFMSSPKGDNPSLPSRIEISKKHRQLLLKHREKCGKLWEKLSIL